MINLKPLHDNVVIKPMLMKEMTKSGIILPDTMDKGKPEKGEVVAVGPGRILENGQRNEMSVKIGDKIIFKKYTADEITVDEEDYLVIQDNEILAII